MLKNLIGVKKYLKKLRISKKYFQYQNIGKKIRIKNKCKKRTPITARKKYRLSSSGEFRGGLRGWLFINAEK